MVDGRDSAWRNRARGAHAHGNTARQATDGLWTEACGQQTQSNDPHNNQHNPQYANYWAPLTRKRHIPPHPAQPRDTNDWAPRTRKRHQRQHRPQRPTERSAPTQHAKGRTGDCPGPRKGATTRRTVTQGRGAVTSGVHCSQAYFCNITQLVEELPFAKVAAQTSDKVCVCVWGGGGAGGRDALGRGPRGG